MKSRTISAEPVMIAGSNPSLMRISACQPRKSKANDRVRRPSVSSSGGGYRGLLFGILFLGLGSERGRYNQSAREHRACDGSNFPVDRRNKGFPTGNGFCLEGLEFIKTARYAGAALGITPVIIGRIASSSSARLANIARKTDPIPQRSLALRSQGLDDEYRRDRQRAFCRQVSPPWRGWGHGVRRVQR
jgi:hypothetical protein